MPVGIEALPDKITKLPHWRVTFRPSDYRTRIGEGPKAAFNLVEKCRVRLGGWSYPFLSQDRDGQIRATKYIASGIDFMGHIEYWRMYYSGQFADIFSVREKTSHDWDERLREEASEMMLMPTNIAVADIPGFVSILNLLCIITEIFEFASRLCGASLYNDNLDISIELRNIKGFALTAERPRVFDEYFPATSDHVLKKSTFGSEQLLAVGAEIALEWAVDFFSQFGWDNPSLEILKGDQQKFLSGRL